MKVWLFILVVGLLCARWVNAAPLDSAELTRLFNRVELLSGEAPPQPAEVGDVVTGRMALQTGDKSRAELAFSDETIARLGANSFFSFDQGSRDLDLKEGVLLLQVPKDAGGANVNTAAVSAAITGTTVLIESRSSKPDGSGGIVKFLVLEGTMRLKLKGRIGESVLVSQGQMLALDPAAAKLPEPVVFDIKRLVETSGLLGREFKPLTNQPFIKEAALRQRELKNKGRLINLNYGIYADRNPSAQIVEINNLATSRTDADAPQLLGQARRAAIPPPARAILGPKVTAALQNRPDMTGEERVRMQRLIRLRTLERIRERERFRPPEPPKPPAPVPAPRPPIPVEPPIPVPTPPYTASPDK